MRYKEQHFLQKNNAKKEVLFFIVFYILVCCFILAFSPLVLLYVGHDISPVLDGVWRIENNQVPHKDFSSILGIGYLLQQYVFLKLFNYNFIAFNVSSIAITTLVFISFLSLYANPDFIKISNRIVRIYLFFLIVALGLGQYNFGTPHVYVTYANLYNRYCFVSLLLILVLLILLKKDLSSTKRINFVYSLLIAIVLNYLLFIKLTYFLVASGFIVLFTIRSITSIKTLVRIAIPAIIIFIIVLLATHLDFFSYLNEYQTISKARKNVLTHERFLKLKLLRPYNLIYLAGFAFVIIESFIKKVSYKFVIIAFYTGLSAVLLHFTNWGESDIVLLSFIPVLFLLFPKYSRLLSFKIMLILSSYFIYKNVKSIYYLSEAKSFPHAELKNKYLSGFYTNFDEGNCKGYYADRIMRGVDLIDKNKKPSRQSLYILLRQSISFFNAHHTSKTCANSVASWYNLFLRGIP